MKNNYLIKGKAPGDAESILRELKAEFPSAEDIRLSEDASVLEISIDSENIDEVTRKIGQIVAV